MKKKTIAVIIAAFACLVLATGCSSESEKSFTAMDTVMTVRCWGKNSEQAALAAEKAVLNLEQELSRTVEGSDVSAINTAGGSGVSVSRDTLAVITAAIEANARTDGAFDITIAPVMDLWDFSGGGRVPQKQEIKTALEKVGIDNISIQGDVVTLSRDCEIDLGGIAKGYAGDVFRLVMQEQGIDSAMAYLGGNVVLVGGKTDGSDWRVAVQDPLDENATVGVITARDCSVVTSGGYERNFTENGRTYHHIIDPATGFSSDSGLISVTIVSENGTMADALSTALYVLGEERAVDIWRESDDFEMLLVTEDLRVICTQGLSFRLDGDGYELETVYR